MSAPVHGDGARDERRDAEDLEALRRALIGKELDKLDALEERLDSQRITPQDVAKALPAAVVLSNERDERLARALSGTIDSALHDSVRRDPQSLADALFPVLGPAIRKAIWAALSTVVESFNRALEDSVSVTGLRWRLEARRTKRPYHEVVLSHTLLYRVHQVFLTHRRTGIMLEHVQDPTIAVRDPDLVSMMLRAIEDFVSDSFGEEALGDEPTALPVREVKFDDKDVLLVAPGPDGVVAAVVEGRVTSSLEERLQEAVEQIHAELGPRLRAFEGDTAPFVQALPILEDCLLEERKDRPPSKIRWVTTAALVALAAFVLVWGWTSYQTGREFRDVRASLEQAVDAADGWSLQSITRVGADAFAAYSAGDGSWTGRRIHAEIDGEVETGGFIVRALRDPGAADFDSVAPAGLQRTLNVAWHLTPYLSLEPWLVAERLRSAWSVPAGVTISTGLDGRFVLSGEASYAWLAFARAQAQSFAGFEVDSLQIAERGRPELDSAKAHLETLDIFCSGEPSLPALGGEHRRMIAERLRDLADAADEAGRIVEVVLVGRDVPGGAREMLRAEYARRELANLVESSAIRWEVAPGAPLGEDARAQCVQLRVRELDEVLPGAWLKER